MLILRYIVFNQKKHKKNSHFKVSEQWYFVTIIVLTYCEKNCSSVRKKIEKKVCKFEAVRPRICNVFEILFSFHQTGAPVAFKTWCGHQYRVGIICPPPCALVEIGLRWLPKLGEDKSPCPHTHRCACIMSHNVLQNETCQNTHIILLVEVEFFKNLLNNLHQVLA